MFQRTRIKKKINKKPKYLTTLHNMNLNQCKSVDLETWSEVLPHLDYTSCLQINRSLTICAEITLISYLLWQKYRQLWIVGFYLCYLIWFWYIFTLFKNNSTANISFKLEKLFTRVLLVNRHWRKIDVLWNRRSW